MPAGTAFSPGGIPFSSFRLGGFCCFPEGEVPRISFSRLGLVVDLALVLGSSHIGELLPGQRAVIFEGFNIKIDVSIPITIGVTGIYETLGEGDLFGDLPGGARFIGRGQHPEGAIGGRELLLETDLFKILSSISVTFRT